MAGIREVTVKIVDREWSANFKVKMPDDDTHFNQTFDKAIETLRSLFYEHLHRDEGKGEGKGAEDNLARAYAVLK
jgi:hypothetical protein